MVIGLRVGIDFEYYGFKLRIVLKGIMGVYIIIFFYYFMWIIERERDGVKNKCIFMNCFMVKLYIK